MEPTAFLDLLDQEIASALQRAPDSAPPASDQPVRELLLLALRNELEASEEAASWMAQESAVDIKLALARQCGDEARHYRLIQERLMELGVGPSRLSPLAQGHSPMFEFLQGLTTTVERIAAGPFAREAMATARNETFAAYCDAHGDSVTAKLYREIIQPDEEYHHRLGRTLLLRLAVGDAAQRLAREAVARTLAIGEEMRQTARLKAGVTCAPGC